MERHEPLTWAPLEIQFADYALWEHESAASPETQAHLTYWQDALNGAPLECQVSSADAPLTQNPKVSNSVSNCTPSFKSVHPCVKSHKCVTYVSPLSPGCPWWCASFP